MRAKVQMPTDDEEAAIQRGIALDPENPEWTTDEFARSRPASEALPASLFRQLKSDAPLKSSGRRPKSIKAL